MKPTSNVRGNRYSTCKNAHLEEAKKVIPWCNRVKFHKLACLLNSVHTPYQNRDKTLGKIRHATSNSMDNCTLEEYKEALIVQGAEEIADMMTKEQYINLIIQHM